MLTRRNFCAGLTAAICAPYVVRNSGVLMPVKDRQAKWIATYSVRGYDAYGLPKSELLRFRGPLMPIAPDITGFHQLANMSGIAWQNITSIEYLSSNRIERL